MDVQWYPGHMTKARRQMEEDIRLVDLVIELVDARTPVSSRNPDIRTIRGNKPEVLILNKADLADPERTKKFEELFLSEGIPAVAMDSRDPAAAKRVKATIREAAAEKIARDRKRGIVGRPVRVMIAGIPNVGKSTLINTLAGRGAAKTGNKPGVTKGRQWIALSRELQLLDTPGILWPKFDDQEIGRRLAVTGTINDTILDTEELSLYLISYLRREYPGLLEERYRFEVLPEKKDAEVLSLIGESQRILAKGGEPDLERTAKRVIDDFRAGRIGRCTLEAI
ncbi:MAG: ribosome biogenesis GTPase YlqF [Lachnospiraceae bacterium]|nr:ribosome biogenesis GTPase YlqF [Lachnospiraceae bacterium]